MHKEGWSINELEMLTPFERDVYIRLYINDLKQRARDKET